MDEPAVSSPAAGSLVEVTVIYQIGPVDLYVVFIVTDLRNQTGALKLGCQRNCKVHLDFIGSFSLSNGKLEVFKFPLRTLNPFWLKYFSFTVHY